MRRLWKVFAASLIVSAYFAAAPFGYAAFALYQVVPAQDPEARAQRLQRIVRRAFGLMHALLRVLHIVDFDPRQLEGEIPEGPCVIVANHPTLMDTSAMIAALDRLNCAVKPAIFHSFWARPLLTQAGHFAGIRSGAELPRMMDEAVDRLARGYRVLMFPEGTRSPAEGGLHPFGRAAFEIAARAQVPIVPVVIRCAPRWLSKEHSVFNPPADVPRLRLRALPAVRGASSRNLRDVVGTAIRAQLDHQGSPN